MNTRSVADRHRRGPARRDRGQREAQPRRPGLHPQIDDLDGMTGAGVPVRLLVGGVKGTVQLLRVVEREGEPRFTAHVAQIEASNRVDVARRNAGSISAAIASRSSSAKATSSAERDVASSRARPASRSTWLTRSAEADAEGAEHPREGVKQQASDAEPAGDAAGVLPARSAEHDQGVVADVVASGDGHATDRLGHCAVGDVDEAFGDAPRSRADAGGRELCGQLGEARLGPRADRSRNGKSIDGQSTQRHVDVRQRQLACFRVAVDQRSRLCAGALRSHRESAAVDAAERATARSDGVNVHHGRADAEPGVFGLVHDRQLPGPTRDVGRGPTHVEADGLLHCCRPCDVADRDQAPRGPREDGVGPGEQRRGVRPPLDCMASSVEPGSSSDKPAK